MPRHKDRNNPEAGQTIALLAVFIAVLFVFASLAIDVGVLFTARTSAQHVADAAALAGVFTFTDPCTASPLPTGCPAGSTSQPTAAINAAKATAGKNSIMGQSVTLADTFTVCSALPTTFATGSQGAICVDKANQRVTVVVGRQGSNGIATYFARVISPDLVSVRVHATAEAGTGATGSKCVKPVYIPNTILSSLGPGGCTTTPKQIIFDPANSNQLTAWAKSKLGQCVNMRPTRPSDSGLPAPGQFFSLDFGSGANTYRCVWANCLNTPSCNADISEIQCKGSYPVKTGDMVGPLKQGVNGLIGSPQDTWISIDQYQTPLGVSSTSKSLVIAPVWDNCSQPITSGTAGQTAKVLGFVEVFVDQLSNSAVPGCLGASTGTGGGGSWVEAHLVNQISCGTSDGTIAGSTVTGPYGAPIRLVKTP